MIKLSKGQSFATATKVSETNYTITVNNSKKKAVGTLDITGAFEVGAESTTSYAGTGADSVNSYCDVTNYIKIGDNKVTYNVETKVKVAASAFMECDYDEDITVEDIFADTVLVDFGYTDDFDVITGAADKPDDKAIISIDYASTFDSDYNNLTSNAITLAKNKDKH